MSERRERNSESMTNSRERERVSVNSVGPFVLNGWFGLNVVLFMKVSHSFGVNVASFRIRKAYHSSPSIKLTIK